MLSLSPCKHLKYSSYDFICYLISVKNTVSHIWLTTQADGVYMLRVARAALKPKMAREKDTENLTFWRRNYFF